MGLLKEDISNVLDIIDCAAYYDDFSPYNILYLNTTENIKHYMQYLSGEYKRALLTTASGDHHLEAILSGIKEIDSFDINRLARYFAELKFGAIKALSKDEFITFMYDEMLSEDIYKYFSNDLDDEIREFWDALYNNYNSGTIYKKLFCKLGGKVRNPTDKNLAKHCAFHFTNYLEDSNYKLVQQRLMNTKINYMESNILDLSGKLNSKYDLMNFTNIYEWINRTIFIGDDLEFCNAIKRLIPFLNKDGKMLVSYLYATTIEDIDNYRDIPIEQASLLMDIVKKRITTFGGNLILNLNDGLSNREKLYAFRSAQIMKHINDLNIELYEVPAALVGFTSRNTDVAVVYKK